MDERPSKLSINPSEKLIKVERLHCKSDECGKQKKSKSCGDKTPIPKPDVILTQDVFGIYYDEKGNSHNIERFTWHNKNKIQVQVINFGARLTSIKMPDRKGQLEDIVLGFDDLAGYLYHKKHYFGATIGRMTNMVRNSTFQIDNRQYWVTPNKNSHHFNGGERGFDQAVWKTYMEDKKVIMSHISPHLNEGYPGDLLVRVTFELSARNEFKIQIDAQCTQPTIVNLSNLTYFNLAGHYAGADHIYTHVVTINSNCYTPLRGEIPTGEVINVVHTECDFQIPKILGKVMGISSSDGYNHNLCVNRGNDQDDCFVARVLHPPSGRMLEVYSNQCGVNFSTADAFSYGRLLTMEEIMPEDEEEPPDPILKLFEKVHKELMLHLAIGEKGNYHEIRDLIVRNREKAKVAQTINNTPQPESSISLQRGQKKQRSKFIEVRKSASESHLEIIEQAAVEEEEEEEEQSCASQFFLTPLQMDYLHNTFKIACDTIDEEDWQQLKEVMAKIIDSAIVDESKPLQDQEGTITDPSITDSFKIPSQTLTIPKRRKKRFKENEIPFSYKCTEKIVGKQKAIYHKHGGIALQTQNYPACANIKNFPSCVLRPGETYKHTITYKFWVKAGNPTKWIQRNLNESRRGY